jgi:hypothetical protein
MTPARPTPSPTRWTPSVSTLYRNVEVLAAAHSPRSAALRLGQRWGFGLPADGRTWLTEFSFPLQPVGDVPDLLRRRGGLDIRSHADPSGTLMDDYLRAGGRPVIVVVDSFYLPYRPAFGRVHSARTIIVSAAAGDQVYVDDCWEPSYRGQLDRRALAAARRSDAVADPFLEPIYWGVRAEAEWFTVTVEPLMIADRTAWARATIDLLTQEITTARRTANASFGLAALRELVELLDKEWKEWADGIARRTLALVLRAELGSRRYLCSLLRNAVALAGRPELAGAVDRYQEGLRHLQEARDTLIKSLRVTRPEYDAFFTARCRDALANEERLLYALAGAGLSGASVVAGGVAGGVERE